MSDYELYHYGVKGMKWGIRRTAAQLGHLAKAGYGRTKTAIDIHKAKRSAKKAAKIAAERAKIKNPKKLTDDELRARIKRLELEKQYKELENNTDPNKRGREFMTSVAETVGKNLISQVGNHYGATALNKMIGEEVIFANNKKK